MHTHRNLATKEKWVSQYESLVDYIYQGYEEIIYEYTNDLSCRLFIQEALDNNDSQVFSMIERIRAADEKLKSVLHPTKECIHGNFPKSYFWFWGIPKNSEELMNEARQNDWI